ncbi:MAG: response regulator transcription factor [Bdellovibrionota bacterium]|nr:response regulator transcription factor [Bdellovibrionota bacterium]
MSQILIVEDETNLGLTLVDYLGSKGFQAKHAKSCSEARIAFDSEVSIVLMDIGLPDGDGIDLAKEFRAIRKNFILLFLSAQNDPETKFQGLEMGAEDFITKPFDLRELTLRLEKAQMTHKLLQEHEKEISIGKLKIRFDSYQVVSAGGFEINLGQKECGILELLFQNKNKVVSRDQIIDEIWGKDSFPSNRTVDNYIVRLRKWMETDSSGIMEIKSVRGVGYQLLIKE